MRPGASVGYVRATRTSLPRWVRTGGAGRLAPTAPRTVRTTRTVAPQVRAARGRGQERAACRRGGGARGGGAPPCACRPAGDTRAQRGVSRPHAAAGCLYTIQWPSPAIHRYTLYTTQCPATHYTTANSQLYNRCTLHTLYNTPRCRLRATPTSPAWRGGLRSMLASARRARLWRDERPYTYHFC